MSASRRWLLALSLLGLLVGQAMLVLHELDHVGEGAGDCPLCLASSPAKGGGPPASVATPLPPGPVPLVALPAQRQVPARAPVAHAPVRGPPA